MSASIATSLTSAVVIAFGVLGIRYTLVGHPYSFVFGRFAIGLVVGSSLSFLRATIVLVLVFILLFFLFPGGSEIELMFPSECLSMLLQVHHDGIVGVVRFKRRS